MRLTLLIHVLAGGVGLLVGYLALFSPKGGGLHRRAGLAFVVAMVAMGTAGALMAAIHGVWVVVNVPAGVITAYLAVTALTTVRPPFAGSRWLHVGGLLVASSIGVTELALGVEALANGGARDGIPAFPFLLFGVIGSLGAAGDLRVMRSGALRGGPRLARHLWRMCTALLISAMSFFLGQADVFPQALRVPALLAMPVVAVLVAMLYWLWRVRTRRTRRTPIIVGAPEAV